MTTEHPFSLHKDVEQEMRKPTTTSVTLPPQPMRLQAPKQCPASMKESSLKCKHHLHCEVLDTLTGMLTTGFLFGSWPHMPVMEASPMLTAH